LDLFNKIADIYGLFFKIQTNEYRQIFENNIEKLNLCKNAKILDIGCGTGAASKVLAEKGYQVTAVDGSQKMIAVAKKKNKQLNIDFQISDISKGLNFADNSFDLVICCYVAHGLEPEIRHKLYTEGKRLTKSNFLIQDFNNKFNPFISIVEFFEGGDYFNFKKNGKKEMETFFKKVEVIKVTSTLNWYICK
jgi:ubiquinone/menaquinone biosynthesis C-methylase UbiE